MQKLKSIITIAGMAALMGAATPVFAEAAPVYDVDTFEAGNDAQDQDLPMPPAPGDEASAQQQGSGSGSAVTSPVAAGAAPKPDNAAPQGVGVMAGSSAAAPKSIGADSVDNAAPKSVGADAGDIAAAPGSGVSVSTENLSPEQRMRRLEQQITNLQNSQSATQVNSLQGEVQSLRGQIETLNHELDTMRTQEKARLADASSSDAGTADSTANSDTDTPVAGVSAKSHGKKVAAAKPAARKTSPHVSETDDLSGDDTAKTASATKDQPNVAEEQQIYQTAYDLIKAKKYSEAVTALQGMLKKYPSGQFASNAHYWLGELYGLMSKNDNALHEFTTVINAFPGSPRVSDAQLKVGLILAAQSKWPEAKKAFKTVINTYPGTASSRLASEQLKQIKLAGH